MKIMMHKNILNVTNKELDRAFNKLEKTKPRLIKIVYIM